MNCRANNDWKKISLPKWIKSNLKVFSFYSVCLKILCQHVLNWQKSRFFSLFFFIISSYSHSRPFFFFVHIWNESNLIRACDGYLKCDNQTEDEELCEISINLFFLLQIERKKNLYIRRTLPILLKSCE